MDNPPDQAHLTLYADLKNASGQAVEGTLKGDDRQRRRREEGPAGGRRESTRVAITPEDSPQLNIAHPKLWWPYGLASQNLHHLRMEFEAGGAVSDREDVAFRNPRVHLGTGRAAAPAVQDQRQEHPDPRRRMVVRHDAARTTTSARITKSATPATCISTPSGWKAR